MQATRVSGRAEEVSGGRYDRQPPAPLRLPRPCACYAEGYAAGKDKAYFEILASLEGGTPHDRDCACRPCQVKTSCIGALLNMMASRSPELFDQVEAWVLDGHDD